jgi:hypothetical protein
MEKLREEIREVLCEYMYGLDGFIKCDDCCNRLCKLRVDMIMDRIKKHIDKKG